MVTVTSFDENSIPADACSSSNAATAEEIRLDFAQQSRLSVGETVIIIWLDANINESNTDYQYALRYFKRIVNSVNTFAAADMCIDFLTDSRDKIVFMIVSDEFGQQIVPLIQDIGQLDSIYVFSNYITEQEIWTKEYKKVKGICIQIELLCSLLRRAIEQRDGDLTFISILLPTDHLVLDLNHIDQSFMYSQLLKEILLEIEQDDAVAEKKFIDFFRIEYSGDDITQKNISKFERDYHLHSPVWWYTKEWFIYSMLNRALRTQDTQIIIKMAFFLKAVYRQIEDIYTKSTRGCQITDVYRGQGMSQDDFEKMKESKGGLLSFNNFLSTSSNLQVGRMFAESARGDPSLTGILFKITIQSELVSRPFALLVGGKSGFSGEKECLFSMHTVFRIGDIEPIENRLWSVELTLTYDKDQQLTVLTDYIRKELGQPTGLYRLGNLLARTGKFDQAEEIYTTLLNSVSQNDHKKLATIYHQLGYINKEKGDYKQALSYYRKSRGIREKCFSANHSSLAITYDNIGGVYYSNRRYLDALCCYKKALVIREKSPCLSQSGLATNYGNIGAAYDLMGRYKVALSFYQKALDIQSEILPVNHPDLATTLNNIGVIYQHLGDHSKTLSFYRDTLKSQERSLPPNHPNLAVTYNNIGRIQQENGDYPNALKSYQTAVRIREKALPSNHPDLAINYNNLGTVHELMGHCLEALSFYEKACDIQVKFSYENQTDLSYTYGNIGVVYQRMGSYKDALWFSQKALEIQEKCLPVDHPRMAAAYSNLALVYAQIQDYKSALSFCQKALNIQEKSLHPNHPELASFYSNTGLVYQAMGNYQTALLFYMKTLEIDEKHFPKGHPNLAITYTNIASVHNYEGDYTSAVIFYQKTLNIQEKFPFNLSDQAIICRNIAVAYEKLNKLSLAEKYTQRAFSIDQQILPSSQE